MSSELYIGICPSTDTLSQLVDGTVDDAEALETHLRACKTCQTKLDNLSQSDILRPFRKNQSLHLTSDYSFLSDPLRADDLGSIGELYVESEIGRGGAGIVFRAFDPSLDRHVAVKVLNNQGSFRSDARFERESKAAGNLRNDYLVSVHSTGQTHDGRPYLIMPLIRGTTLKAFLRNEIPDARKSATIVHQIALGLYAVHSSGLIHRDVKPANILIDQEDDRAKLTDFGLAREEISEATLTQADVLCGTPEYMSPEQVSGAEITNASDIYGLGITLYESLTGVVPFRGRALDVLAQHREQDPVLPSQLNKSVPPDLETICLKAIEKEPSRRYRTSAVFAADLRNFLDGKPILARPSSKLEKSWRWAKRNRALATSLTALFIVLSVSTIVSSILWKNSERNAATARNRAESLQESLDVLRKNQENLNDTLRSTYLNRLDSNSGYRFELPIAVRNTFLIEMVHAWRMLFERSQNDEVGLRQMANELTGAGEFSLEHGMRARSRELTSLNREIVDQLMRLRDQPLANDLILAAQIYNQYTEALLVNKIDALDPVKQAGQYSKLAMMRLEHASQGEQYQLAMIQSIESARLVQRNNSGSDKKKTVKTLQSLLEQIEHHEKADSLQKDWWDLEQQVLADLARSMDAKESIGFYEKREQVLNKIVDWQEQRGEESDWVHRKLAVNRVSLGIRYDMAGNPSVAQQKWLECIHHFNSLIGKRPLNGQYRADLLETLLIQANFNWRTTSNPTPASKIYDPVKEALRKTLQVSQSDQMLIFRGAQICDLIGTRYFDVEAFAEAGHAFRQAAIYAADANTFSNSEVHRKMIERSLKRAADAFAKAGMDTEKVAVSNELRELDVLQAADE